MTDDILHGALVRLAALNPDTDAEPIAGWWRNSEFSHLLNTDAPNLPSVSSTRTFLLEEATDEKALDRHFSFAIRTLADDRLIGFVDLEVNNWPQRDAWLAIGIGLSDDWGQGYGTDAMRVLMRYGFMELNLERLTLNLFSYNERALRSYLKAGFVVEGRQRECLRRGDQRYDMIFMGVLRDEWRALMNGGTKP